MVIRDVSKERRGASILAAAPLLVASVVLASCGPVSERVAYERCTDRARLADGPRGNVGIGVGTGGVSTSTSLTISSDYIAGRDPRAVYDSCFRDLTGAGPTRPLIL